MRRSLAFAGCIALLVGLDGVRAGDWPQFRGPSGSGLAVNESAPIDNPLIPQPSPFPDPPPANRSGNGSPGPPSPPRPPAGAGATGSLN